MDKLDKVQVVQPEEVVQPVAKQKLNGDAYLSNLSTHIETIREGAFEHEGGQVAGKVFAAAEAVLADAGISFTEATPKCEACAKSAETCTCDLRCPDHPDEDDDAAMAEHEEAGCEITKALRRCKHRGPLHLMRGELMHIGCAPQEWVAGLPLAKVDAR